MNSSKLHDQMDRLANSDHTLNILSRDPSSSVVFAALIGMWRTQLEILKYLESKTELMPGRGLE